jgi:hypothetical protein
MNINVNDFITFLKVMSIETDFFFKYSKNNIPKLIMNLKTYYNYNPNLHIEELLIFGLTESFMNFSYNIKDIFSTGFFINLFRYASVF